MAKVTLRDNAIKLQDKLNEQNDMWCKMTRPLMGDTMLNMDDILAARKKNSYIGRTIDDFVDTQTRVVGRWLKPLRNYRMLAEPSKAAKDGAVGFVEAGGASIGITRPYDTLVSQLGELIDLNGLEELYLPTSLIEWSFAVLTHYVNYRVEGTVTPEELLSIARFGEAQLYGSSEDTMKAVLDDMESQRFRSHKRWVEMMVGEKIVHQRVDREFEAGLVRFTGPREERTLYLIHEIDLPYYAQLALRNISDDIDIIGAWEMRKIHYQACEETIDVKDLEHDDMACPICLMTYENGEVDEKGMNTEIKNEMKDWDDETENKVGRETENQIAMAIKAYGPVYDAHEENTQPIKLKCGHIFGTTCIEKWLSTNSTCPLCRVPLVGPKRDLKPISPAILKNITDYDEAWGFLFCEEMDFDSETHVAVEQAIENRRLCAYTYLSIQFQQLREIDERLGTVGRKGKRNSCKGSPVARWMDKDWDRFASNALTLREVIKEHIYSLHKCGSDQSVLDYKRSLAEMLTVHRERLL